MRTHQKLHRKLLIVLSVAGVLLPLFLMLAWVEGTRAEADATAAGGFNLSASPASQGVCIPGPAAYEVTVQAIGDFSDPVTLSTGGVPGGYSASFDTNPVFPTGNSIMSLANTGAATAGSYNIDIVGVSPTQTVSTTVKLDLYNAAPAAVTLLSPADGVTEQPVRPLLQWSGVGDAAGYLAEVAVDAGFATIVDSATVDSTSYQVSVDLALETTYYWRVTPQNSCGSGSTSAAFSFTTVSPVNEAPLVGAGLDQTITLPGLAMLNGSASDDGLPDPPGALTTTWSQVSGPGKVTFANANALQTTADFSTYGVYLLRLTADDGELSSDDEVTITVNAIEVFLPLIRR